MLKSGRWKTAQAYDDFLFDNLIENILKPASAVIESELRLRLFAVSEMVEAASGDSAASAAAAGARDMAAAAADKARWAVPIASLRAVQLVTSVVSVRCSWVTMMALPRLAPFPRRNGSCLSHSMPWLSLSSITMDIDVDAARSQDLLSNHPKLCSLVLPDSQA